MTPEPEWLLEETVLAIHRLLIAEHGGAEGVSDLGLLRSTLARPQNLAAYGEREPTLFELAASYAYGLARNHCFVDGNKRIALAAALTFLELHGLRLDAPKPETFRTMIELASGGLSEAELASWLGANCRQV
ncbi:MAG TPA: type II toxin-antitoxin system death-on-curing family toxin [Thermoanaerobaculia bacterium]|nr:type II toxin-antitoxin system death-on-curing family toxin [Thermoanaerobaculia bacterium]